MLKRLDVSAATPHQHHEILKYASDVRKFEINLFWQRSLFFWGFIGAAFVAFATLQKQDENDVRVGVACFGLVCSFAWTLQNRGSKYWQEAWEQKVEIVERAALGAALFSNLEPRKHQNIWESVWGAHRFSVSGLTTALSDFTVLVWAALLLAALPHFDLRCNLAISTVLPAASLLWMLLMLIGNRRRDK